MLRKIAPRSHRAKLVRRDTPSIIQEEALLPSVGRSCFRGQCFNGCVIISEDRTLKRINRWSRPELLQQNEEPRQSESARIDQKRSTLAQGLQVGADASGGGQKNDVLVGPAREQINLRKDGLEG